MLPRTISSDASSLLWGVPLSPRMCRISNWAAVRPGDTGGDVDRRQPRGDHLGERGVVVTDDADLVGDPHPAVGEPVQQPGGDVVVERDDRGRPGREDEVGGADSRGEASGERTEDDGPEPEPVARGAQAGRVRLVFE